MPRTCFICSHLIFWVRVNYFFDITKLFYYYFPLFSVKRQTQNEEVIIFWLKVNNEIADLKIKQSMNQFVIDRLDFNNKVHNLIEERKLTLISKLGSDYSFKNNEDESTKNGLQSTKENFANASNTRFVDKNKNIFLLVHSQEDIINKRKKLEDKENQSDSDYALLFGEVNESSLIEIIDEKNLQKELKLPDAESIKPQYLKNELQENFCDYQKKIPKCKRIITPAYWGILDLTKETKELNDRLIENASRYFANKINWNPKCAPSVLQHYFDKNCEEKIDDYKYDMLHNNIQFIKSNMSHFKRNLSEEELKMTTMLPLFRGIFSSELVDDRWGEIQSVATNEARNKTYNPLQRARIGKKVDMKGTLTCAPIKFEVLYGKVSGGLFSLGLPTACKRKKYLDKVKLSIMMRDSINRVLEEWKNLSDNERSSLIVFGWTQIGFDINIYAMSWEGNGIYFFGLVDKCTLPTERDDCGIFEDIYCILKELEVKIKNVEKIIKGLSLKNVRNKRRRILGETIPDLNVNRNPK